MFITMALVPPLMKSAARFEFIDEPGERKVHSTPIPRIGGVAMVIGVLIPVLLWAERPPMVIAFLLGIGVILAFGIWDDRAALSHRVKFFGQFLAIAIVVFYGDIKIYYLPFHSIDPVPEWFAVPFTFFALLGVTNAINLSDGLDGLAGGTMLLSIAAIGLMGFMADDHILLIFSLALMGSIIGFLRYNTHPAQVFMGDCGSQFLGFSVGVLVVILTQKTNPALSPSMTLLLLGLPIIDTFIVMGQRVWERRSPFSPDRNHIHHKLLNIGFDHYEAVVIIYVAQALLVLTAFWARYETDLFNMSLFSSILLSIVFLFRLGAAVGWRAHERKKGEFRTPLARFIRRLRLKGVLDGYPTYFIALSVPIYLMWAISGLHGIPKDGAISALVLLCTATSFLLIYRVKPGISLFERVVFYVTTTMVVYYANQTNAITVGKANDLLSLENFYFVALVIAIVTAYRFIRPQQFSVTPTDFLVIFLAIIAPGLLGSIVPHGNIMAIGAKTVILFYAFELIFARLKGKEVIMRLVLVVILAYMTINSMPGRF